MSVPCNAQLGMAEKANEPMRSTPCLLNCLSGGWRFCEHAMSPCASQEPNGRLLVCRREGGSLGRGTKAVVFAKPNYQGNRRRSPPGRRAQPRAMRMPKAWPLAAFVLT